MTIHTILVKYKDNIYSFDVDKDYNGEIGEKGGLYLVSPLTGELIAVPGKPLREKYEIVARKHLKQMNV